MESNLKKTKFFIYIKIISKETCKEKYFPYSKYTQYAIKIFTNDKTWELKKRYSNFYELHQTLSKKFNNIPKFPPKKIFKSDEFIKERQEKLEKYINILLTREDIYKFDEIFDFIEMEKEYYLMLKKNIEEDSTNDNSLFSTGVSEKVKSLIKNNFSKKSKSLEVVIKENFYYSDINYSNTHADSQNFYLSGKCEKCFDKEKHFEFDHERKYSIQLQNKNSVFLNPNYLNKTVSSFLRDLNKKIEIRCEIVKNFEKSFYSENSKVCFDSEHAYKILFGELNTEKNVSRNDRYMFGLIHHSGTIEENLLGAESCLELLSKLIDCQYNPNSEFFVCLLKSSNVTEIFQMNIERHLKSKKSNVNYACYKIIEVVSEGSESQNGIKIDYLVKSKKLRDNYFNWVVNRF
jgi:hypothetical protein